MENKFSDASEAGLWDKSLIKIIDRAVLMKKGVLIYGGTGVGKTYFCHAVANHKGMPVYNWPRLVNEFMGDKVTSMRTYADNLNELIDRDGPMIIDDIGSENASDSAIELMYRIVDGRYRNMKRLMLSTNLKMAEFNKVYGDRIMSRLVEMCVIQEITGKDLRLEDIG